MLKKVTAINYLGNRLELDLVNPYETGLAIMSITGLGPMKATINTTEIVSSDGSLFNSSRLTQRNIVIKFAILPSPTIEEVRHKTYTFFPVKQKITLEIETDFRTAFIDGYVESNEPSIFSKMETTTISIICPNPNFYSSVIDSTVFSGVDSNFEFPIETGGWENPHTEIESVFEPNYVFSIRRLVTEQDIYYTGDSETGVLIKIHAVGRASGISIYNSGTRESMVIDTDKIAALVGSGIVASDDIIISTTKGNKYIRLLRNGVYTNILNALDKNADWFSLAKGHNVFAYTARTGIENLQFSISSSVLYEGL